MLYLKIWQLQLFAGVLTLFDAIQVTDVGDLVADYMIKMAGDTTNPYVMMAVFFLILQRPNTEREE